MRDTRGRLGTLSPRPNRTLIARGLKSAPATEKPQAGFEPVTCGSSCGAGDGNRTRMTSLEGWGSAIELHPRDTAVEGGVAGR